MLPLITELQEVEPIALGCFKVRHYAEVPEQDEHLPFFSIYMAIVWRLVIRSSEKWEFQLFEFSWWL
jgi:hypothetical protein